MHVQIWGDMLEQAGFKQSDIRPNGLITGRSGATRYSPPSARPPAQRISPFGQPMGVESTDSFQSFYTFMDAYNVNLVDENGKLLVDDPKVRQGLIGALKDYTDTYVRVARRRRPHLEGPGQQRRLPQQDIVMTHNSRSRSRRSGSTMPQTGAERPSNAPPAGRRMTKPSSPRPFPNKPEHADQIPFRRQDRADLRERQEQGRKARNSVKFLMQEENLRPYVEGALGRWFPVTTASRRARSGRLTAIARRSTPKFTGGTQPFDFTRNYSSPS